jgi:hypothetical protein
MRDDLDSLNPGKAIAQGSHATNDFEYALSQYPHEEPNLQAAVQQWRADRSFGLCYTLAANEAQIDLAEDMAIDAGYPCGKIIDPTYPIKDGKVTHYIPLLTCGWVFVYEKEKSEIVVNQLLRTLRQLPLYK